MSADEDLYKAIASSFHRIIFLVRTKHSRPRSSMMPAIGHGPLVTAFVGTWGCRLARGLGDGTEGDVWEPWGSHPGRQSKPGDFPTCLGLGKVEGWL